MRVEKSTLKSTRRNLLRFLLIFIYSFVADASLSPYGHLSQLGRSTAPYCYECSAIVKFVFNSTHCSHRTLSSTTVKSCSPNMFCYVKITTPSDPVNEADTLLRRGCSEFNANSCKTVHNKNGVKFTQCIKSCNKNYCNSDDIIEFDKSDENTLTECPGNSQINTWRSNRLQLEIAVLVFLTVNFNHRI